MRGIPTDEEIGEKKSKKEQQEEDEEVPGKLACAQTSPISFASWKSTKLRTLGKARATSNKLKKFCRNAQA